MHMEPGLQARQATRLPQLRQQYLQSICLWLQVVVVVVPHHTLLLVQGAVALVGTEHLLVLQ